jgi:hypothetical protein
MTINLHSGGELITYDALREAATPEATPRLHQILDGFFQEV